MKKYYQFLILIALLSACAGGKKTSQSSDENWILKVGDQTVSSEEFDYVYKKNNNSRQGAYSDTSVRNYLDLYTKFKLKVLAAEEEGLDTMQSFKNELETYRKQLARPYMTETSVIDSLVEEAYQRLQHEVRAKHILIKVGPNAAPKDTAEAYAKIKAIKKKIEKGASFEEMAKKHSKDEYSGKKGGDLGYFTGLNMVYPFETAAYTTPEGELSPIFRTRFGYHLLKVEDKRPSSGKVKVAHIMVKANPGMPKDDSIAARNKIDQIYASLEKGSDWDQMVTQYSEDPGSRGKGGELPMFGINEFVKPFEEAAFSLTQPGEYTKPFRTPYGWHIVKLIDKQPLPEFEEMKGELEGKVKRDSRSQLKDELFYKRLRKENNLQEKPEYLVKLKEEVDTSVLGKNWNLPQGMEDKELFRINEEVYSVTDFFEYANRFKTFKPKGTQQSPGQVIDKKYADYVEYALRKYEEAHLADKYKDYRMLLREYRDGILLFKLMDEKVWSKAVKDTAGLKAYFAKHNNKYTWEERADLIILKAQDKETRKAAAKLLATYLKEEEADFPVNAPAFDAVRFDKLSASINMEKNAALLDRMVKALESDTTYKVQLIGYKLPREKGAWAKKRAQAVRKHLLDKGISARRLSTFDGGPVPSGITESGQAAVKAQFLGTQLKHIERHFNQGKKNALSLDIKSGKFEQDEKDFFEEGKVQWKPGEYAFEQNGQYYLVVVKAIEEPRKKYLNEVRGLAISDYQSHLEKEWIKELKKQYKVEVNEESVEQLIEAHQE